MSKDQFMTVINMQSQGRVIGLINEITVEHAREVEVERIGNDSMYVPQEYKISGDFDIYYPLDKIFLEETSSNASNYLLPPINIVINMETQVVTLTNAVLYFDQAKQVPALPEQLISFTGRLYYTCDSMTKVEK